jgi:hypothetical protein
MKYLLTLLLTISFTQELQVEGNLKVTGSIDAQGNPITNVGNPIQSDDAVNMGFLQTEMTGLSGMKPERIYRTISQNEPISLVVPNGKSWRIAVSGGDIQVTVNDIGMDFDGYLVAGTQYPIWILPNDNITISSSSAYFTIFEYSISGSGSEQGLDYIEP